MSREPDRLLELCRAARRHEEPDESERRALTRKLAARGLLPPIGAAAVLLGPGVAGASTSGAATAGSAGTATATAAATTGVAAAGTKVSLAAVALYVASGVGGGLMLAAGGARMVQPSRAPTDTTVPAAAQSHAVPRSHRGSPAPVGTPPAASAAPSMPLVAPLPEASSGALGPRPIVQAESPLPPSPERARLQSTRAPSGASDLAEEARGLMDAERALRDGDAEGALQRLAKQQRLHADGSLSAERQATRVLALCAAGRISEAQAEALRFLAVHGDSPLAARIRESCGEPRR